MSDLIRRQDAIEAIEEIAWYHQNRNREMVSGANSTEDQAWYKSQDIYAALEALPSAETRPTVIRSRTLLPTKDFMEWAKRIKEVNPNVVVIPCDAEVASAEARPTGTWIFNTSTSNGKSWNVCSECGDSIFHPANFCPNCGADMRGDK